MNKRKKIKALKAENKLVYKTLNKYLNELVAVEMALNPDNPFMAPGYPSPAQQVKDLIQDKKNLLAEIDILTGKSNPRPAPCERKLTEFEIAEFERLQAEIDVRIRHNDQLREQAHADRHALSIGCAINRAAELLPDETSLVVEVESWSGTVDLFIHGRLVTAEEFHGDTLSEEINAAIDYAIAVAQEQEQQP